VTTHPVASVRRGLIGVALIAATIGFGALAQEPDQPRTTVVPAAAASTLSAGSSGKSDAVQPVPVVDLERFLGEWYEIARIPAWFQNRCVRDTTARYQLRNDGRITVINRCVTRNGRIDQAQGLARVLDPTSQSRLKVSFVSLLGWRPFWGDYWIIGLDPEYRWLAVGDPGRQYGWILSRSSTLAPVQLEAAFQAMERNGYARDRFRLTPQNAGALLEGP